MLGIIIVLSASPLLHWLQRKKAPDWLAYIVTLTAIVAVFGVLVVLLIVAVDRLKITSERRWETALSRYQPGDTATIRFVQRGIEREAAMTFDEDPRLEIVTFESVDREVSDQQLAFRQAWLVTD